MSDHVVLTDQNSIRCNHCGVAQELPCTSSMNVWSAIGKAFDKDHRGCKAPTVPVCVFCRAVDHSSENHVKVTCKHPWQWPSCGDTGLSSRALFDHFTKGRAHNADAPSDPSDFGRCYRLLGADFAEGWAERIKEMSVYPQWAPLVPHWSEITKVYEQEKDLDSLTNTYVLMMKIQKEAG